METRDCSDGHTSTVGPVDKDMLPSCKIVPPPLATPPTSPLFSLGDGGGTL